MEGWTDLMLARPVADRPGESIPEMLTRLEVIGRDFAHLARTIARDGRYDDCFVDVLDNPPIKKTFGGAIGHVLTHNMHHRAQNHAPDGTRGADRPHRRRPAVVGEHQRRLALVPDESIPAQARCFLLARWRDPAHRQGALCRCDFSRLCPTAAHDVADLDCSDGDRLSEPDGIRRDHVADL
jgi:hypothetical protein